MSGAGLLRRSLVQAYGPICLIVVAPGAEAEKLSNRCTYPIVVYLPDSRVPDW